MRITVKKTPQPQNVESMTSKYEENSYNYRNHALLEYMGREDPKISEYADFIIEDPYRSVRDNTLVQQWYSNLKKRFQYTKKDSSILSSHLQKPNVT